MIVSTAAPKTDMTYLESTVPAFELDPVFHDIMGVDVLVADEAGAIQLIDAHTSRKLHLKLAFLNAHVSNVRHSNPEFAAALDGFLVLPDGAGVELAARILHRSSFPANLNGTDFVPLLLRRLRQPLTVGLVGASQQNIRQAAENFAGIAPQHDYHVISDGFFSEDGEAWVLDELRELRPDILLVAMGVPRQELWISRLSAEHAGVAIGVGALFDFVSGAVPRAPLWMRRAQLEWLFRLIQEPGRLWRRYLLGNPRFLWNMMRYRLRQRADRQ